MALLHRLASARISLHRTATLTSHLTPSSANLSVRIALSVPDKMKGVTIEKTGGTEVLQYKTDLPVPEPKEGQILVKNDFIGINYIDTYVLWRASECIRRKEVSNH